MGTRVLRDIPAFKRCFDRTSSYVGQTILTIWASELNLVNNSDLAQMVLNMSLDNFFLQITDKTLTYDWVVDYVNELKTMVIAFQRDNQPISVR